ncbi:hypothetical protein Q8F55_001837 [Vanrija albida]|uniref:Serine/threonine-protein phosphatase 4 regulatory subunit 3-like central domain-containing protein n=1 Tax=Vanrija albida TaxID=181172 RepID=A0ABR3Q836_9TREE
MARPREGSQDEAASAAPDVSFEVVGSREHRGHRRRASSITTSPPPPPHDFNPPPDFQSELLLQGITTSLPPSSTASPSLNALSGSDPDDVPRMESLPTSPLVPGGCSGEGFVSGSSNARPQIRALQRLSTDSLHRASISSGSAGSGGSTVRDGGSDGGEILAARRDELVSQLLHSDIDSPDPSRRPSSTSGSSPPQDPFELNVINPTPPTSMLNLRDEAFVDGEGGGGTMRPRSSSRSIEEGATVHAWDSVWPVASAMHRPSGRVPTLGTSPPISWILNSPNRPRGDSSGLPDQFTDAAVTTRRDSHRPFTPPLQPGSNPRRRLSETAVLRRPQGLAPLESLQPPPSTVPADRQSPGAEQPDSVPLLDVDREVTTSLSPNIPVRPGAPRRVRSEQDARGFAGQMFNITPIDKSLKRSSPSSTAAQLLTELDSRSDPRLHRKSPRRSAGDLPPAHDLLLDTRMDSAYESVFEMDEYAVDDENDVDDNDVGFTHAQKHSPSQEPPQPPLGLSPPSDLEATSARLAAAQSHPSTTVAAALVDEGDVLPANGSQIAEMDVTFDDEGLNTLERIFLLSRSEYAFHRAYVARVLGDLLSDVDPCESVEYVLPLISSFSLDEDDSVKEAFAVDLHRILWYFFSTCHLVKSEDDYGEDAWNRQEGDLEAAPEHSPLSGNESTPLAEVVDNRPETTPSQPMDVPRPAADTPEPTFQDALRDTPIAPASGSASTRYGTSSTYSTEPPGVQTPATSMSLLSSDENCGGLPLDVLELPASPSPSADAEVVDKPVLAVDFFRPLLGTLLLSQNPAVADPVRNGIVSIISRLSGAGPLSVETWGANCNQPERSERRTYQSQNGPHAHDFQPFDPDAMALVEHELLYGIVLGVGTLATDVPDSFFDAAAEPVILDDGTEVNYNSRDREFFRQQMLHEATLGRALSLSFIGSVCEFYTPENVVAYGFVDEVIRGLDGDATTRAEAALTMSYVAKVVPPEDIDRLLPVFNEFARDEDQQVRQSACVCMPALCKRIPDTTARRAFATSTITVFMESSDEVRSAALEVLGEVIYAFSDDPLGPPPRLLEVYLDDGEASGEDGGWDLLASYNFPGVCLTLGPDRWPELRGLFNRLVSRAGDRVLRTVAAFLHELAQILRPDQVAEDILPVYRRCLQCCDEIRERIFEHVDLILKHVDPEIGWQSFSDLVNAWSNDTLGGWRAREQLALHIPAFFETFHSRAQVAVVLDMMRKALRDPFAAVRDAATFAVPLSYETLRNDVAEEHGSAIKFHDMLLDLAFSDRFRHRVTFVRCLREFERPPPNKPAFEKFFVPALPRLSQDVVDVRLGLAQCVSDLFVLGAFYGDRKVPVPDTVRQLAAQLAEDDSADVRDTITRVGADKWVVEASAPAAMELAITEDPVSVSPAVDGALRERREASESYREEKEGGADRHPRAAISSPVIPSQETDWMALGSPGDDDPSGVDSAQATTTDPFAASFARATKDA